MPLKSNEANRPLPPDNITIRHHLYNFALVPQTWRTKPLRVSALLTNKLGADTSEPSNA